MLMAVECFVFTISYIFSFAVGVTISRNCAYQDSSETDEQLRLQIGELLH